MQLSWPRRARTFDKAAWMSGSIVLCNSLLITFLDGLTSVTLQYWGVHSLLSSSPLLDIFRAPTGAQGMLMSLTGLQVVLKYFFRGLQKQYKSNEFRVIQSEPRILRLVMKIIQFKPTLLTSHMLLG